MQAKPSSRIAVVDVDAVCADIHHRWLGMYNAEWKDNLQVGSITNWDMTRFVKEECGKRIYGYLESHAFYDEMPPVQGALEGVNTLRSDGWRVVFVTAGPLVTAGRKMIWLREHGFLDSRGKPTNYSSWDPDYFEGIDKSLIRGNLIIDDNLDNVANFEGEGIVFAQPWNQEAESMGLRRAADWADVIRHVRDYHAKTLAAGARTQKSRRAI